MIKGGGREEECRSRRRVLEMLRALLPAACRECEKAQVALRNEALQVCGNDIPLCEGQEDSSDTTQPITASD